MSTTTHRPIDPRTEPEQQPWRSADDRQGWKVAAVGARHPGAFLREVQEYLQRHDVAGQMGASAQRAMSRSIVEALLGKEPETTSADEVRGFVRAIIHGSMGASAGTNAAALAALADEIVSAWRRYAARGR